MSWTNQHFGSLVDTYMGRFLGTLPSRGDIELSHQCGNQVTPPPRWSDDAILGYYHASNGTEDLRSPIRYRDLMTHILCMGATGSGKSSGPGHQLSNGYLRDGFGGLWLCAKASETDAVCKVAKETGRESDLVLFGSDRQWRFNPIQYELTRNGRGSGAGYTENVLHLINELSAIGSSKIVGGQGQDPLWENMRDEMVRNAVDLLLLADSTANPLLEIYRIIRDAPRTLAQSQDVDWCEKSHCMALLKRAKRNVQSAAEPTDFERVETYWRKTHPERPEKMRASYEAMYGSMADVLTRGKLKQLFCADTTITPEAALGGRIIVVDLPEKECGKVGRYAAVLWKYMCQRSWERRKDLVDGVGRPLFIWADECQYFTSAYDPKFLQTARSSRVSVVYLTQNKANLEAEIGGEVNGSAMVRSLLGNFVTRIYCCNGDDDTNKWAAETIAQTRQRLSNANESSSVGMGGSAVNLNLSQSSGFSEQYAFEVQPHEFTTLRCGGRENNLLVDAIVFQPGRRWRNGKTWLRVTFKQF